MRIRLRLICLMALGGFLLSGGTAWAQLADKKVITLGVAKKLVAAAEEEAAKSKWNVVIVIVDDGGNLLYLQRCAISSEGGLPIVVSDKVIGAIGVSGVTAQQDGQIAKARVDALPKILGQ